jgi:DNA primase
MPYIDFAEIKQRVSIEEVVSRLGLKVTKRGHQLRAACPACKQGGDRALAITPQKSLFYCFADFRRLNTLSPITQP